MAKGACQSSTALFGEECPGDFGSVPCRLRRRQGAIPMLVIGVGGLHTLILSGAPRAMPIVERRSSDFFLCGFLEGIQNTRQTGPSLPGVPG